MNRDRPRSCLIVVAVLTGIALLAACGGGGGGSSAPALTITSTPPTETSMREAYSYQVVVSDPRAAGLSYRLTEAPPGMTVSSSGLVAWTPAYSDMGQHRVTVEAANADASASQSWDLRVHEGINMGVTLSPRGHTSSSTNQDYIDHFAGHAPWGRIIAFHSKWRDSVESAGQIPQLALTAEAASQQYGFTPVVGFGWADGLGLPDLGSQSAPSNNSWSNVETRDEFVQMVTDFARTYRPPYLFLGNETNTYYLTHPGDWANWISEFEAGYDAIKAVSPGTIVYTTFQLERMKGLGATRNGWRNPPNWEVIQDHARIDAIGFTSYPYFEYNSPAGIPDGYYDEISTYWTGPVLFSEIGWLAQPNPPYPGSESDQSNFIPRFFDLAQRLDLECVVWLFLHDWDQQATVPAFVDIGLRSNDGSVVRAADRMWQASVSLRQR